MNPVVEERTQILGHPQSGMVLLSLLLTEAHKDGNRHGGQMNDSISGTWPPTGKGALIFCHSSPSNLLPECLTSSYHCPVQAPLRTECIISENDANVSAHCPVAAGARNTKICSCMMLLMRTTFQLCGHR